MELRNKFKEKKLGILSFFILSFFVICLYLPTLNEGYFVIDDDVVMDPPQVHYFQWSAIQSIFEFGNNVDYYPIRDLSYAIDWSWGKDLKVDAFPARVQNLILFIGVGLVFFLILIEFVSVRSAVLLLPLWFLNAYHAETVVWLAARKDLLALIFGLLSVWLTVKVSKSETQHRKMLFFIGLCFLLSLLSKSSFALFPFVGFGYWIAFLRKDKRKRNLGLILANLCLISVGEVLLQKFQYSDINDMFFPYSIDYRVLSTLAALGRMFVGFFYFPANAVEPLNFYPWLQFNTQFISIGVILFVLFTFSFAYFFLKDKRLLILFCGLILASYVIEPGPNFLHRNFYSTRYFEVTFLILFFFFSIQFSKIIDKLKSIRLIVFCLGIVVLITSFSEMKNWYSGFDIVSKAYRLNSENPGTAILLFESGTEILLWGKATKEQTTLLSEAWKKIDLYCSPQKVVNYRNSHQCTLFWRHAKLYQPYVEMLGLKFTNQSEEINESLKKAFWYQTDRYHFLGRSDNSEYFSKTVAEDTSNLESIFFPTERIRIRHIFGFCYKGQKSEARNTEAHYIEKKLLERKSILEVIAEMPLGEDRTTIHDCLFQANAH